jgi:hypothetical protein
MKLSSVSIAKCKINIFAFTNTDVNECLSNPCENKGTCEDKVNGRICHCVDGYEGTNCEIGRNFQGFIQLLNKCLYILIYVHCTCIKCPSYIKSTPNHYGRHYQHLHYQTMNNFTLCLFFQNFR